MTIKKISLKTKKRWKVVFRDKNKWLSGLYSPEFTKAGEIKKFEKHSGPELFLLLEGRMTLVLLTPKGREEIPLKKGEAVIVDTYHNAYRPRGAKGLALVIEKDNISTQWKKE